MPGVLEIMDLPVIREAMVIPVIRERLETLETKGTKVLPGMGVILAAEVLMVTPEDKGQAEILEQQETLEPLTLVTLGRLGQQQLILASL